VQAAFFAEDQVAGALAQDPCGDHGFRGAVGLGHDVGGA
jgi:hypothetical protein